MAGRLPLEENIPGSNPGSATLGSRRLFLDVDLGVGSDRQKTGGILPYPLKDNPNVVVDAEGEFTFKAFS